MAVKKSTRKFQATKLKGVLERRKESKKIKQVYAKREKRKAKRKDEGGDQDADSEEEQKKVVKEVPDLNEMSVDAFLGGGFKELTDKKTKRKRKIADVQKDNAEGSQDEKEEQEEQEVDEMVEHEQELAKLKEADPEFYKYLAENDAELLDFKAAELEGLSDIGSSEDEGEERTKKEKKKKAKNTEGERVTEEVKMKMVKQWSESLKERNSLTALRKVVLAFRAAAHMGDVSDKEVTYKYSITNPQVYHELMVLALDQIPEVLKHHIPIKESAGGKTKVPTESKKFQTLSPLLKSHSSSLLHLLPTLSDAGTVKKVLKSATELLPYLLSFRKFLKAFVKAVVEIWSSDAQDEATRITAFLVVRRAIVIGDDGLRESSLKAIYSAFVRSCRNTTQHTLPGINLMKNSAVELVGIDEKVGYTLGFGYIRQLAVHLRSSITDNSKEAYKLVYNWQYVHSLDFWSRVLSAHCSPLRAAQTGKESLLQPLIYPLVQVTLGAIRLIPTQQYFPLHFHLHRSLLRLSAQTGVYIPLLPTILTPLSTTLFKHKAKPGTLPPLDFATIIRAPKTYLGTRVFLQDAADQMTELISEFFVLHCKSIAFPELAAPGIVHIKRYLKKYTPRGKWVETLRLVVQKLEANSEYIQRKRSDVTYAPDKREEVDAFLKEEDWESTPIGAYVSAQRKLREEREKAIEEGRKAEEKRRREMQAEESDEDGAEKFLGDEEAATDEEDEKSEGDSDEEMEYEEEEAGEEEDDVEMEDGSEDDSD